MRSMKFGLVFVLLLHSVVCCAITIDDVQKLGVNSFFGAWSKFLDQVLEARQYLMSDENEAIYQAFIQQGTTLNIPKVTGNKESVASMQRQMDLIKKRVSEEKNFFAEWDQFFESVLNEKQYPVSPENEEAYKVFVERAKNLRIQQPRLDEMQKKMDETNEKLSQESAANDPSVQRARLEELQKKVDEMSEKLSKQEKPKEEPSTEQTPVDVMPEKADVEVSTSAVAL